MKNVNEVKEVKIELQKFSVKLVQTNKNGVQNFAAFAESIRAESLEKLSGEISDFCHDTAKTFNELKTLKMPGAMASNIKKSSKMSIEITAIEDDTKVSISIANFGKFLVDSRHETTTKAINLLINYTSKFAHLWS